MCDLKINWIFIYIRKKNYVLQFIAKYVCPITFDDFDDKIHYDQKITFLKGCIFSIYITL